MILALWSHSAVVRANEGVGAGLYERIEDLRKATLDLNRPLYLARGEDRVLVERTIDTLDRGERWGLVANPRTPLMLAWMHLLAGDQEEFSIQIEAATHAQPGAAEVYLLRGRELVASRRFPEAVAAYTRAIECEPKNPAGFLSLGSLLAGLGDLEGAIEVFGRGIGELPQSADLYYNSGVAHAMRGDMESAAASFRQTLTIDPDHLRARENLAGLLAMSGVQ